MSAAASPPGPRFARNQPAAGAWRLRLACPDVGEEEVDAIRSVLLSGVLTNGEQTRHFEDEFAKRHDTACAVAMANGTVALASIYLALGIGPGDEVLVPSLTFISSATSILHVGAKPIFVDVDDRTFNLDPEDVARKITSRTRAIVAVHYGGQPADLDELNALALPRRLAVIEDAAEAHGAQYHGRPVGGIGIAAMFSFTPTKNITTGEGGIVTTNDGGLAERLRLLRNHGQTALYQHETLGFNWRMTELQAAMGLVQLSKLDNILRRKAGNARRLNDLLRAVPGLSPPVTLPDRTHVHMLYTVKVAASIRDDVRRQLEAHGIETRLYFPPAHQQPIFRAGAPVLPVTERLSQQLLSLPFHSLLTSHDLADMAEAVAEAVGHATRRNPS
jgi:perosamine synthetase